MRISDRYITKQILTATIYAILFLTIILVLGTVMKEVRKLLVDFGAPPSVVGELIVGALPVSLIYTIPWAFLAAVLLVVGRMSNDQEITAFRVSGVSLTRLMAPIFVIGAALSALCLWLNITVAPNAYASMDDITFRTFRENSRNMLAAAVENDGLDQLEEHMKGVKAFIKAESGDDMMEGVHFFRAPNPRNKDDKTATAYVYAKRAQPISDDQKEQFSLKLYDAVFATTDEDGNPQVAVAEEAVPVQMPYQSIRDKRMKPKFLTNQGIRDYVSSTDGVNIRRASELYYVEFISEIYRRFGTSFACLAFAFVGVPLGIKARRKDTSTGLVISLFIGTAYFAFSSAKAHSLTSGMALAWGPDAICLLLGLYLLRRSRFR